MVLFNDPRRTLVKEETTSYKIQRHGVESLDNVELLSLVIGNGTHEDQETARAVLNSLNDELHQFKAQSEEFWAKIPGIGKKKARSIVAMNVLQKRIQRTSPVKEVSCSRDAYDVIAAPLFDLDHEQFWIINLNRANKVMSTTMISSGGVAGTVVDAKIVFRKAIEAKASAIILSHNHPSGNLYPSHADLSLTEKLVKAGKSIDIPVLDHIIVGGLSYYSFADEGKL